MSGDISHSEAWQTLEKLRDDLAGRHLQELFAQDAGRVAGLSLQVCGLYLDYSKQRVTAPVMQALTDLADSADLPGWRRRMFSGEKINNTELRAVLHVALRNRSNRPIMVDGADVMPEVNAVLERMRGFVERVREGQWLGHTGRRIRDVVNIGIGGSDLGPAMVCRALDAYSHPEMRGHFVSNLDATQLNGVLSQVDPETTLFVVASKTFTTQETLTNARSARRWLLEHMGGDESAIARHFVAVSTNAVEVSGFGIDTDHMFEFWDWVGGRYSLWSSIGLSIALMVGMEGFEGLLGGAHAMDEHFQEAPLAENMPVIMGLLGIWNSNFLGAETLAILPYDLPLELLPSYLQQLEMESNGKGVSRDGQPLAYTTCPIVWGAAGNNGQHAFYQLLHQGRRLVPADFIVAAHGQHELPGHQEAVLSNALAQTEALMQGRSGQQAREQLVAAGLEPANVECLVPHRTYPGNQPTSTLLYERLDPAVLGALIALYEHKVFVQSVIWDINAFDQWGVELGKEMARTILPELVTDSPATGHDASTNDLINRVRRSAS